MLGFLEMLDDYDQRKVARYEKDGLIIDTCKVTDSRQPFETAIQYPDYRNGGWVIVEMYDTKKAAIAGHKRWVSEMTTALPDELVDVSSSDMAELVDTMTPEEDNSWRHFPRRII
jgi:hypothetical protein